MHKLIAIAALTLIALSAGSQTSTAGGYFDRYVQPFGARGAHGSVTSAREGSGGQYIGCYVIAGSATYGYCGAMLPDRTYRTCFSSNPDMMRVMGTVNRTSYIRFSANATGQCDSVLVDNSSRHTPEAP